MLHATYIVEVVERVVPSRSLVSHGEALPRRQLKCQEFTRGLDCR